MSGKSNFPFARRGILCPLAQANTFQFMEWNFQSAEDIAAALRAGAVTSVELTDAAITRIERDDKAINAICVPDFDNARAAARAADQARAGGENRPLLGIPVTVKESYDIAGLPTTWGMPQHANYVPAEDAVQVSRLKAAGAVILGKTNVPVMLRDIQSFNEIYGTTNNPWDHNRTSGGSSGGSAAALASGFGALSIGSDLAGSLRTPAHFCGVYAHKPTLGLAPTRGMVAPSAPALPIDLDLAVVGPMARTARDLSLLLDVMAGPDPLTHGLAYDVALPPARHDRLADFRVLIIEDHPLIATGSAVRAGVNRVAEALVDEGARVERHSPLLPDPTDAATLYMQLMLSNAAAGLPLDVYRQLRTRAAALSPDDRSLDAARLRGMVLSHRDWVAANNGRELHRHGWRQLFAEFDAVVCPITPTPAYPHDHHGDLEDRHIDIDGVAYPYFDQLVWAGMATMPGLPATAVPAGRSPEGLPVGVQLIGPMFEDRTPLRLAELLEEKIGGFQSP
ncbi:amidase [Nocardia africana]|uniref:Glutamyl-tRNA(Gln) amidotransferase subunit A n=1 Tax=Nocardia africana TaxID=134964 RepID=A0A378WY76_9NOCA|nr:amidase [Nocardia africana]MCC3313283.1 amidase [Nocardia africana]SUA45364.1 Glutamyl-tRNA(Gln) amidotransferase subunit A [Nocardia africana]